MVCVFLNPFWINFTIFKILNISFRPARNRQVHSFRLLALLFLSKSFLSCTLLQVLFFINVWAFKVELIFVMKVEPVLGPIDILINVVHSFNNIVSIFLTQASVKNPYLPINIRYPCLITFVIFINVLICLGHSLDLMLLLDVGVQRSRKAGGDGQHFGVLASNIHMINPLALMINRRMQINHLLLLLLLLLPSTHLRLLRLRFRSHLSCDIDSPRLPLKTMVVETLA